MSIQPSSPRPKPPAAREQNLPRSVRTHAYAASWNVDASTTVDIIKVDCGRGAFPLTIEDAIELHDSLSAAIDDYERIHPEDAA